VIFASASRIHEESGIGDGVPSVAWDMTWNQGSSPCVLKLEVVVVVVVVVGGKNQQR
jgi:hypothetical protein